MEAAFVRQFSNFAESDKITFGVTRQESGCRGGREKYHYLSLNVQAQVYIATCLFRLQATMSEFVPAPVPDFPRASGFEECDQQCDSCERSYDPKVIVTMDSTDS